MQGSNNFRLDIQGLRGIAVLLVVLYHLDLPWLTGGYIGVDIFFVISGYLITGHLAEALDNNRFSFSEFYARRVRRIIPASIFVLFCTMLVSWFLLPPLLLPKVMKETISTALYLPNIFYAYQQTDYLAETAPSPLLHYWSLGVEEQFYFIWPLLLFCCWRLFGSQKKYLAGILIILLGLSLMACILLTQSSQPWAFFLVFTRAWELGFGGLLAFWLIEKKYTAHNPLAPFSSIIGWSGLVLVGSCAIFYNKHTHFPGFAAALPVLGAALILLAGAIGKNTVYLNKVMGIKPLQYMGLISYSLYLWHWPVIVFAQELWPEFTGIYAIVSLFIVSAVLAELTYRFIEQPFRNVSGKFYLPAKSALISCGAASIFLVLIAGGYGWQVKSWQLFSDQLAQEYVPDTSPEFTGYVPRNLAPDLRQVSKSVPKIYNDGCHDDLIAEVAAGCVFGDTNARKTYVLYGDSHAAQWFPALQKYSEKNGVRLVTFTKSSCPATDIDVIWRGGEYTSCVNWRKKVLKKINQLNPDVVIVSSYYGARASLDMEDSSKEWMQGLVRMFTSFPEKTQVVIIGDTPSFTRTPALCLSKNLSDTDKCAEPRGNVVDLQLADMEEKVARDHHQHYIDMNRYLCTDSTCGLIVGNVLIYRDRHHITVEFSEKLADVLGGAIDGTLISSLALHN
ncbi:acyltransferase family protein [Cellvibrio sp. KY-GH-1]|uniref:acyltransferase family protein n=1 Tax=Cellvibrio sp. KY-GH-1 TaxID=2303332 RepID=UPI00177AE951|nr:acyltransferase family protein [Cellvibrio sp. KY-GH-1]